MGHMTVLANPQEKKKKEEKKKKDMKHPPLLKKEKGPSLLDTHSIQDRYNG